jgi:hypothetical protein
MKLPRDARLALLFSSPKMGKADRPNGVTERSRNIYKNLRRPPCKLDTNLIVSIGYGTPSPRESKKIFAAPRNIHVGTFVYTSAAGDLSCSGFTEETPRWQPRGVDTQSFRPLVQEERCVLQASLLVLA